MGTVGQTMGDVLTLGQTAVARRAANQQESMLRQMNIRQAEQLAALEKIGPAPMADKLMPEDQSEFLRKKRLESLRAGLASTIKSPYQSLETVKNPNVSKAKKLGE